METFSLPISAAAFQHYGFFFFWLFFCPRGGVYYIEIVTLWRFCSSSKVITAMCCVNWNRRYLQDMSAIEQHQDFLDKHNITVRANTKKVF